MLKSLTSLILFDNMSWTTIISSQPAKKHKIAPCQMKKINEETFQCREQLISDIGLHNLKNFQC